MLSFTALGQTHTDSVVGSSRPFILGMIDQIHSKILNEKRILNIYLPEGYHQNDKTKYPVVYVLDGSADEDFIHIAGLYQFNSFPWINRVPQSIIVGIANVDRKRDFTFPTTIEADKKAYPTTGHSERFIDFIANELQPYIEHEYKTNLSKTIIGQSLGGLLATEILLKYPTLFNEYIIVSPSLWWDDASLLNLNSIILTDSFKTKTDIYLGVGKEGLSPGAHPRSMEKDVELLSEKLKSTQSRNLKIYFDYLPQEDHATILHQAVYNALRLLNPSKENER